MTLTEKYNFKIEFDQGGNFHHISENFQDNGELLLLNAFEEICLSLKEKKSNLSMVELGANQAYYSLLFKYIIGIDKTFNIMVEADPVAIERGKHNFALNSANGIFLNKLV